MKNSHQKCALFMLCFVFGMSGFSMILPHASTAAEARKHFNRLAQEKSSYLLRHKDHPVWWYPWGEAAFRAAREENKPIFLLIGYSSCHWCHVMEQDAFARKEVAAFINQHFIAIIVDREDRPDVDQIYMDVLLALNGSGDWPASLFLTPERVPFFGTTYVSRQHFMGILQNIHESWQPDQTKIKKISQKVSDWMEKQNQRGLEGAPLPDETVFRRFMKDSVTAYDPLYGGFGTEPKFPDNIRLAVLLRIYQRTQEPQALKMVRKTLDAMARGGIYDHLGGGFHRYAIDQQWQIPHFEKMLYDNALSALIYLEARQVTQNQEYALIAREILDYVLREMTRPQGGFYAAEDADSEKTEGKYYLWTETELKKILNTVQFRLISLNYNVTAAGNFQPAPEILATEKPAGFKTVEQANVFFMSLTQDWPDGSIPQVQESREKLLRVRAKRKQPLKDTKILTAWNGLMISAMAKGYQVLGDANYLKAAQQSARFILKELRRKDGQLLHLWKDKETRYHADLNDYAYLIQSLLRLYQSDFDPSWIQAATQLQTKQDQLFWQEADGVYFFSAQADLPFLQHYKPIADNVLPAGNAVAAENLLRLSALTLDLAMKARAQRLIGNHGLQLLDNPVLHAQLVSALDYLLDNSKEIVVIGSQNAETQTIIQKFQQTFLPNTVLALGSPAALAAPMKNSLTLLLNKPMLQEKTTIYVCENNVCQLPTTDSNKALELASTHKKYQL